MRKAILLLIYQMLIVFTLCVSCSENNSQSTNTISYQNSDELVEATKKLITEITADEFKKVYSSEDYFVLIDVRTKEEYEAGYIPGAVNINRGQLEFKIWKEETWDELGLYIPEKTDLIVVYCRTGGRSALAAKSLMDLGYQNVKSLKDGWKFWNETYPELKEQITIEEDFSSPAIATKKEAAGGC